jgi:hypothetical protein
VVGVLEGLAGLTHMPIPRAERIRELREQGWTLAQIATEYGVSRERVRQILLRPPRPPARRGLSPPTWSVLRHNGLTPEQTQMMSDADLLELRRMGLTRLSEIRAQWPYTDQTPGVRILDEYEGEFCEFPPQPYQSWR